MAESERKQPVTFGDLTLRQQLVYASYEAANFAITRLPYLFAVLLMVTFAEEMKGKSISENQKFDAVYYNLAIYFLTGTIMSFDLFSGKRVFALITCLHLMFICYQEFSRLSVREIILSKLLVRNIGNIGAYLMVAGGIAHSQRGSTKNRQLLSFGIQIIGAYSFLNAVLIHNSSEEFNAFATIWPGGVLAPYLAVALYTICCIGISINVETVMFSKILALVLLTVSLTIDMQTEYWNKATGIKYWMTMTIAARNIGVVAVLFLERDFRR